MSDDTILVDVPEGIARERLDRYLTHQLPRFSRSKLQKLIEDGLVTSEGKPLKSSHPIVPGETITIHVPTPKKHDLLPEDIPIRVVYEDGDLLVVDKAPGLVVHPAYGNYTGTLVNALLHHCNKLSGISGYARPGVVHRLDKDTSGLLVAAKNDFAHRALAMQFAERTIEREYHALIWRSPKKLGGEVITNLARHPKDRTRMVVVENGGKEAITRYQVIRRYRLLSLAQVKLGTGRTHQIRVHFLHLNHPVFGDAVYGGKYRQINALSGADRQRAIGYLSHINRQALHAKTLGFNHPTSGEQMFFEAPYPEDMGALIDDLERELKESA